MVVGNNEKHKNAVKRLAESPNDLRPPVKHVLRHKRREINYAQDAVKHVLRHKRREINYAQDQDLSEQSEIVDEKPKNQRKSSQVDVKPEVRRISKDNTRKLP